MPGGKDYVVLKETETDRGHGVLLCKRMRIETIKLLIWFWFVSPQGKVVFHTDKSLKHSACKLKKLLPFPKEF